MQFGVFLVPLKGGDAALEEFNRFLRGQRVLAVERRYVEHGDSPAWAFCVEYLSGGGGGAVPAGIAAKIDYREVLNAADFAVFSRLRIWRKELADKEAVPAYAILTNEQLAAMVQQRVATLEALGRIPGVGKARVEKYGAGCLEILGGKTNDETSGPPAASNPVPG